MIKKLESKKKKNLVARNIYSSNKKQLLFIEHIQCFICCARYFIYITNSYNLKDKWDSENVTWLKSARKQQSQRLNQSQCPSLCTAWSLHFIKIQNKVHMYPQRAVSSKEQWLLLSDLKKKKEYKKHSEVNNRHITVTYSLTSNPDIPMQIYSYAALIPNKVEIKANSYRFHILNCKRNVSKSISKREEKGGWPMVEKVKSILQNIK